MKIIIGMREGGTEAGGAGDCLMTLEMVEREILVRVRDPRLLAWGVMRHDDTICVLDSFLLFTFIMIVRGGERGG